MAKYDEPMAVGEGLVVRVRQESHPMGPFNLITYRLTHPRGRRRLAGTAGYFTREAAMLDAESRGWLVLS